LVAGWRKKSRRRRLGEKVKGGIRLKVRKNNMSALEGAENRWDVALASRKGKKGQERRTEGSVELGGKGGSDPDRKNRGGLGNPTSPRLEERRAAKTHL